MNAETQLSDENPADWRSASNGGLATDYKQRYLQMTAQYTRDIDARDALINSLADYVERVPDDRYNAEHLDRDALVAKAKEILDVSELGG